MNYKKTSEKAENLVGLRYSSLEVMSKKLTSVFGEEIEVSESDAELTEEMDNQLVFAMDESELDVDLYYLKDNADNYYITEVCVNRW
jgi:hypothetical protein